MSLSILAIKSAVSNLLAQQGAPIAMASGALLAGIGIFLGSSGMDLAHHAWNIGAQVQQNQRILSGSRLRLLRMQRTVRTVSGQESSPSCRKKSPCSAGIRVSGYTHVAATARALMVNFPHMAVRDEITLTSITTGPGTGTPGGPGTGAAGFPGVKTVQYHLQGSYQSLAMLERFFHALPPSTALTSVLIQDHQFHARITAYGLAS